MKILAFDTSNSYLSVALLEDKNLLQIINIDDSNQQSQMLLPLIEKILRDNNIWYQDLNLVATTKGPGSFTGVRVGLACAKTLAISLNAPLVTVDSLEAVAYKYRQKSEKILVIFDAKMDEFFVAEFLCENEKLTTILPSKLMTREELENVNKEEVFLCGTAVNPDDQITADLVGMLAYEKFLSADFGNSNPAYLRLPRITERKK